MSAAATLNGHCKTRYLHSLAGRKIGRGGLRGMLAVSSCVGAVLVWSLTAGCGCATCGSMRADSQWARQRKHGPSSRLVDFSRSPPDLGDPRIGARMADGKLAASPPERLVVAARFKEDILWMHEELNVPYLVYQVGDR